MADFRKVAAVADIPVGTMKSVEVAHERILVCHTETGFFAVADECSHDSAPMGNGHLHRNEVTCPRHGARFDITSGAVLGPPAVVPIDTFKVKVEGEDIFILVED